MAMSTYHHWNIAHNSYPHFDSNTIDVLSRKLDHHLERALKAFDANGDFNREVVDVVSPHAEGYKGLKGRDTLDFLSFVPFRPRNPTFTLERV